MVGGGERTVARTEDSKRNVAGLTSFLYESRTGITDSDCDGLPDTDEAMRGTDRNHPDSDGDGYRDGDEIAVSSDPLDPTSHP